MRMSCFLTGFSLALIGSVTGARSTAAAAAVEAAVRDTAVPAMAVAERRGGQVIGAAVRGRRNDSATPARVDDAWLIGSDAKPMTAALIARRVVRLTKGSHSRLQPAEAL